MRSLLLTTTFRPRLGGIETLLYQTSRRLSEPPLVMAPAPASASGVCVRQVRLSRDQRALYRPLWALHPSLHYAHAFVGPAAEAIHAHGPRVLQAGHVDLAPLVWLLARRSGRPFVVYAYGQEVWRGGRRQGLAVLDRVLRGRALAAADAVLVPGTFTTGLLADWPVDPRRIRPVPFGAQPRPLAMPPTGRRLLSVARLVPRKGIDRVLQALASLPGVEYRVVGQGPDQPRLRALAQSLGVADRVRFLGRLSDDELEREYAETALLVLPARRTADGQLEGYGLVYFEAAAWGRPAVAGRSGGEVDAIVDGQTGLLVDGASHAQVRAAVASLLDDVPRLRAMGAAARARVESTHNWQNAAGTVDAILASLA